MKKKKIKVKYEKLEKVLKKYGHFGWKPNGEIKGKPGEKVTVILYRNKNTKNGKRLAKLEKLYKKVNKHFPTGAFIDALIAGGAYYVYKFVLNDADKYPWNFAILAGVILFAGFGIYHLIAFIALIIRKRRFIKEIYEQGDEIAGNTKTFPLKTNVAPPIEDSNLIKKKLRTRSK